MFDGESHITETTTRIIYAKYDWYRNYEELSYRELCSTNAESLALGCDMCSEVTHASDLETTCLNFPPSLTAQGTLTTMHV